MWKIENSYLLPRCHHGSARLHLILVDSPSGTSYALAEEPGEAHSWALAYTLATPEHMSQGLEESLGVASSDSRYSPLYSLKEPSSSPIDILQAFDLNQGASGDLDAMAGEGNEEVMPIPTTPSAKPLFVGVGWGLSTAMEV